ncbi:iron ABC transporter permease [Paenibacillus thalictri]|uniref:Iron ABC transporter permease n=2 Tax=Paenibacillus thalictri TaxID=2527873 RepID=A0A4Q9DMG9_9BACL|nr:iron ABC transporter permease [Paenibacillus thalictri]
MLAVCFMLSIVLGANHTGFAAAIQSFIHYDASSTEQVIIQTTRLPRAIVAMLVGANLAVSGALMQALTRNPLASPGIFGINAGAVFFVVLALALFHITTLTSMIWIAFAGAAVAALTVYALGSMGRDGLTPLKIVLSGAAMTAFFSSFTHGMLVLNETRLQDVLFWMAGSVAGRDLDMLAPVLPYMLLAGVMALLLARPVNLLASGEEVAKGLGQRTMLVKLAAALAIVLLAGSSVAVAGAIGFVGLVIPHIARFLVGADYRWVIPFSAILGAVLLLLADLAARFVIMPAEVPIGVMTALVGAPFFIYMARKGLRSKGGTA